MPDGTPLFGSPLRTDPANLHAEQALLGALLTSNQAYERVAEFLRPHHFADPINVAVYAAIERTIAAGRIADAITLRAAMEHDGILAEVGGIAYLAQLMSAMVGTRNAGDYGRAIHDAWMRRELLAAAGDLAEGAYKPPDGGAPQVLEAHEARLLRIAEGAGDVTQSVSAGAATWAAVEAARAAAARGGGLAGLSTGLAALDRMTKGLAPSRVVILGARPAMGKTALGLSVAARAAALGKRVGFWSGEMDAQLPTTSVLTGMGYQPGAEDEEGAPQNLTTAEWDRLDRAAAAAAKLPLVFNDRAMMSVAGLRAWARREKRGAGLDLLVVDYLGLLRGSDAAARQGKVAEITEISRDLLALGRELHIALLVLVQLNRGLEGREDKRPHLGDLRDSGAIEQDASVVMFLHRPHYYLVRQGAPEQRANESDEKHSQNLTDWNNRRDASRGVAEVLLAKNRQGPTGITRLRWLAQRTWFQDETEDPYGPAWAEMMGG
jgi:replicative DNA helicase